MDIASKVKQRSVRNTVTLSKGPLPKPPSRPTRGKPSPKKKASPHLKSLSKARKISARRNNNAAPIKQRGTISRLLFSKSKKKSPEKTQPETPTKPAFYRTRNAATAAYEEKLEAVRAASQDLKKLTKTCAKKETVKGSSITEDVCPPITKFETINDSRVLACGLWYQVGDIVSVYGDEEAHYRTYYAQILLFLKDRYGEVYCEIRWLIPVCPRSKNNSCTGQEKFDFNNYLEGPQHTEPIKVASINFVAHALRGPGTIKPGLVGHLLPNPSFNQYRQKNEIKILDVPTRTATTTDPKLRNPYM